MVFIMVTESKLRQWPWMVSLLTGWADPDGPSIKHFFLPDLFHCANVGFLIHPICLKLSKLFLGYAKFMLYHWALSPASERCQTMGCVVFSEILASHWGWTSAQRVSGSSCLSRDVTRDVELVRRLWRHEYPTCILRMPARGSWWADGGSLQTRSESVLETVGASGTEGSIGWQRCQEPSEPASPAPFSQAIWEDTRQWVSRALLSYQCCFGLVTRT